MSSLSTSTFISTIHATNHGHLSSVSLPEAMDVDANDDHRAQDEVLISPTLSAYAPPPTDSHHHITPTTQDVSAIEQPTIILDPPRACDGAAQPVSTHQARLPQRSNLSRNFLHVFELDSLAATVARTDPITGEKINKMRKSYEGQLKGLRLTGKNKSVKHEDAKFGLGLCEISNWPEEEWQRQKVHGKEVRKGLPESISMRLEKAMQMQPGPVPRNNEWEDLLGIDRVKQSDPSNSVEVPLNLTKVEAALNGGGSVGNKAQDPDVIRPKRTAKKRRYDEGSFEGYGEGYVDDDIDVGGGGYTSGETHGSRNSATKRRRKTKDYGNNTTGLGDRTSGNYGAAPLGISAYGR